MKKKMTLLINIFIILFLISKANSCPTNCLSCTNQDQCITCHNQYHLTIDQKCVSKTIQNCRIYFQHNKCAMCQSTFKLQDNGKCVKDTSGCLSRNQLGVCQQCGFGTTLNIKGQCLGVVNCIYPQKSCKQCRFGYSLINNKCVHAGSDCDSIVENGLCILCKDGFILNGFECINKGSNSVTNGNINLIYRCSLYSKTSNECLQCQNGYSLFNNICTSNGQIYNLTIETANDKIRQNSNQKYINTPSQFILYQKVRFSLANTRDDVLDAPKNQIIQRVTFQGIGSLPENTDNCLIRAPNSLACSVCLDGYYYFNGVCKKKTSICTKFNHNSNKCVSCSQNFLLINGECLDPNCQEVDYAQCTKCKQGFLLNQESFCYDPRCLTKKQGICTICNNGYIIDDKNLCYKPIQNCLNYNPSKTTCIQCQGNYLLVADGNCKQILNDRCLRYNTNNNNCIQCRDKFALALNGTCIDINCRTFSSINKCQVCNSGYILHPADTYCFDVNCVLFSNGTCINCANNYKLQNRFCVNVLIGCLVVQPLNQNCIQCMDIYRLQLGKCIYSQNDRCIKYFNNICIACKPELALVNGSCVDLLCQRQTFFNNFYSCTRCKPGFNVTAAGRCYDENCFKTQNGSCVWCADNYIIGSFGLCVKTSIGCLNWNQTQKKCRVCSSGYLLQKNGYCSLNYSNINVINNNNYTNSTINTPTTNNDTNKNTDNNQNSNQQTNNSSGFNNITNNSANINNSANVKNSTNFNNSNNINNVNPAPSQKDNTSTLTIDQIQNNKSPNNDPNCKAYDSNNNCITCQSKYLIRYGKCQLVPDFCKSFSMKTGNCTSCQNGYAIYGGNQYGYDNCLRRITQSDSNCLIRNLDLFCIKCKPQFFIKAGICYPADNLCKSYNLYGGQCTTCYDGFTLEYFKCVQLTKQAKCKTYDFQTVCIQCQDRYYVEKGICKQVDANCLTYQMSTGICYTCVLGYDISNGLCIKIKQLAPNCLIANNVGTCTQCRNRFYLDNISSNCISVNILCNDYNKLNGLCLNCNLGYKLRSDFGLCVFQSSDDNCSGFDISGACINCRDGYFLTKLFKCMKFNSLCENYNQTSGDCQRCKNEFYLSFKQCLPKFKRDVIDQNCLIGDNYNFCIKCKDRYFINTGVCLRASDQCKTYSINTGGCESCYQGFVIQNKECVQSSKINRLSDGNCALYSGNLCIKCKDSFYLSYDTSLPLCTKANPLCKSFNQFNGNCYTCIDGYKIQQGYCVIIINNNIIDSTTVNKTNLSSNTNNVKINTLNNSAIATKYIQVTQLNCKQYDLDTKTCINCYDRYYYNIIQSTCKMVSSGCKTYNNINGWCTSCFDAFYLNRSACIFNSTSASLKQQQDILSNNNNKKLNCQKYDQNSQRCLTCFNGYQLLSTGFCTILGTNIINDPFCTAVTERKCVNCLSGYYVEINTGLCTLQSLLCASFNIIGGQCYKCQNGNVLQDGVCFKPALGIDPFCSFYSGAYCRGCINGYKLDSFVCLKIDK